MTHLSIIEVVYSHQTYFVVHKIAQFNHIEISKNQIVDGGVLIVSTSN